MDLYRQSRSLRGWTATTAVLAFLGAQQAWSQEFAAWTQSVEVTMNTTSAGANVAGKVSGYPVAITLPDNFPFAAAKPDGSDLRVSQGGTAVPFHIELFDAAAKKGVLWAKLDVEGNNASQKFTLHWGNAAASAAGDSKKVFSKADGFLGVWHLGEDGGATPGAFKDASEAEKHGTGINLAAGAGAAGVVGMGVTTRNAQRQYVEVGDSTGYFRPTTELTASIWGAADAFNAKWGNCCQGYQCVFSSGEGWAVQREMGGKWETCFNGAACAIGKGTTLKVWSQFVVRRIGSNHELFQDGAKTAGSGGIVNRAKYKPLGIGQQTEWLPPANMGEQRSWDGILDEARVMNKAVSNDWIKLDYESQKPGSKFLAFGTISTSIHARIPGFAWPASFRSAALQDLRGRVLANYDGARDLTRVLEEVNARAWGSGAGNGGILLLRVVAGDGKTSVYKLSPTFNLR